VRDDPEHLRAHVHAVQAVDVQPIEERSGWPNARFFVPD